MIRFSPLAFISSIFFRSFGSAYGPFFSERATSYSSYLLLRLVF